MERINRPKIKYLASKISQTRLLYAQTNINRNWDNVISSDEKTFRIGHLTATVWGWISSAGPGELTFIDGRLNSVKYVEILKDVLVPSVEICYESLANLVFMQDNSPAHVSRYTRSWFDDNHPEITTLYVPPDCNPIEGFWRHMMRYLGAENPHNRATLEQIILQRWESFHGQTQYFENLYNSTHYRIQQVISNNGGPTAYWSTMNHII